MEPPLDDSKTTTTTATNTESNKRKRDAIPKEKIQNISKSTSTLSFFQPSIKKMKKTRNARRRRRRKIKMKNIIKNSHYLYVFS